MIKFEDFISDTCKQYFKMYPDMRPSKLSQIQYLINAYYNDVSNPPGLYDLIEYLENCVTKEDSYYHEVQTYIKNIKDAINSFKISDTNCVFAIDIGDYIFRTYKDAMRYVKNYMSTAKHDDTLYDQISIDKVPIYSKNMSIIEYSKNNSHPSITVNKDMKIVNISDDNYKIDISFEQDTYPELLQFQPVHLPYKPGDILVRRGPSIFNTDDFSIINIMLFDWERTAYFNNRMNDLMYPDVQISMGKFYKEKFFYDHRFCLYEFEKVDINTSIKNAPTEFRKRYFSNIKDISNKIKNSNVDFNDALNICIKKISEFASTVTDQEEYWRAKFY